MLMFAESVFKIIQAVTWVTVVTDDPDVFHKINRFTGRTIVIVKIRLVPIPPGEPGHDPKIWAQNQK
jgi:hypothetical protein